MYCFQYVKEHLQYKTVCGEYRNRTDDLLTARDNTGFSTQLHYTLLHYITIIM